MNIRTGFTYLYRAESNRDFHIRVLRDAIRGEYWSEALEGPFKGNQFDAVESRISAPIYILEDLEFTPGPTILAQHGVSLIKAQDPLIEFLASMPVNSRITLERFEGEEGVAS